MDARVVGVEHKGHEYAPTSIVMHEEAKFQVRIAEHAMLAAGWVE